MGRILPHFPAGISRSVPSNGFAISGAVIRHQRELCSIYQGRAIIQATARHIIEDCEAKHYELPKASPTEVIRFLMDQHGLKQQDLFNVFGDASVASEVRNGKRELSKEHIRRLVDRFSIPADMLM